MSNICLGIIIGMMMSVALINVAYNTAPSRKPKSLPVMECNVTVLESGSIRHVYVVPCKPTGHTYS